MNALSIVPTGLTIDGMTGTYIPYEAPKPTIDRETWLNLAAKIIIEIKFKPIIPDYVWPVPYRISVGFAPNTRTQGKVLGVCCPSHMSADKHAEVFICPHKGDSKELLAVLAHELIHSADDCLSGHRGFFAKVARGIGLTGPLTATSAGPELVELFDQIIEEIGEIPHAALVIPNRSDKGGASGPDGKGGKPGVGGGKGPQKARMLKVECNGCGWSFRTSNKNIEAMTDNSCLACGTPDALHPVK